MEDKNNFIFTYYISGIKGMAFNTMILLVNNTPDKTLDIIFKTNENDNKTIKIPVNNIKNISFNSKVRMQNVNKDVKENETKSNLLSAVVFGGNPLLQLAGTNGFNNLFNSLSNNYNKVDYNEYFEITIETSLDNQDLRLLLSTDISPELFINEIKNNLS